MANEKVIRRVLIADGNADSGDTLGCFLETLGMHGLVVRDGEAAMRGRLAPCLRS